jgi:hypothetical protein
MRGISLACLGSQRLCQAGGTLVILGKTHELLAGPPAVAPLHSTQLPPGAQLRVVSARLNVDLPLPGNPRLTLQQALAATFDPPARASAGPSAHSAHSATQGGAASRVIIIIRNTAGAELFIKIRTTDPLIKVKHAVAKNWSLPVCDLRLLFGGVPVDRLDTCAMLGVKDNDVFDVVHKQLGD